MKFLKRLALTLLALCVLLVVAYFFRVPLLRGAANHWIVNDPLAKADVIVVLGGGLETRPLEAARLYHQGLAPKILLMNPKPAPTEELGLTAAEVETARQVLLKKDVPASAIALTGDKVSSTYEESVAVRNWARTNGVKRVIIPTDIFHTRRVRWLFGKQLGPSGIQVEVEAVPAREYTAADWWQHEQGVVAFQNEVLKWAYYRLKY